MIPVSNNRLKHFGSVLLSWLPICGFLILGVYVSFQVSGPQFFYSIARVAPLTQISVDICGKK